MGSVSVELDSKFAYKSLDLVTGKVHHQGYEADTLIVHLTGTTYVEQQRFVLGSYKQLAKTWEFLRLTQSIPCSPTSSSTSFTYRLPEALLDDTCPLRKPYHLLIPATIGCEQADGLDDLSPTNPVNAKIEYKITVDLLRSGSPIGGASVPFRVAPRAFAVPDVHNPPPEYDSSIHLVSEVARTWGGKVGTLSLDLLSPPPLLTSLEEHQQTTSVPLTFVYSPGGIGSSSVPPQISAVQCRLEARTTSRLSHLFDNEEGDAITRSTFHNLNKVRFSKLAIPVWSPYSPTTISNPQNSTSSRPKKKDRKYYATYVEIPVTLMPKGKVAVPVFDSCLVDRTYILHLTLHLLPSSTNSSSTSTIAIPNGLSSTAFAIPVWIFADEYFGIPSEGGERNRGTKRFTVPEDYRLDATGTGLGDGEDELPGYMVVRAAQLPNNGELGGAIGVDDGGGAGVGSRRGSGLEEAPAYFEERRDEAQDDVYREPAWLLKEREERERQSRR